MARARLLRGAVAALCLAGTVAAAPGAGPAPAPESRNVYTAGGEVRPRQPVAGDLTAAGGRVVVEHGVGGDAALAGGAVDVRAPIGDDLRVVGGSISIESKVGGDVVAAGADVALRPGATVVGAADLSGANVVVEGRVEGGLRARGQKILVDGEVRGPAHLIGERIELGAKARMTGPLTYESPAPIGRAEGAVVDGPITRSGPDGGAWEGRDASAGEGAGMGGPGAVLLYLALFAFSSVFLLLMPRFTGRTAARLRASPWAALGLGAAGLFAVPLLAILLSITVLGIPLALALLAAYPVMLLAGFAVGVLSLARLLPNAFRTSARTDGARVRLGYFALALAAVMVLGLVPVIGPLFIFLLALAGFGAGVLQVRSGRAVEAAGSEELPLPGHDVFPA